MRYNIYISLVRVIYKKKLLKLFFLFFKISLLTFGGGYTCFPIMEKELVQKEKMISEQELLSNYAVAQMMPGLITINIGVLIGYKRYKIPGAVAITLGTITPPLIIGLIISIALNKYLNLSVVSDVFWGIKAGVCVLIFTVIYKLIKMTDKNLKNIIIILSSLILYYFFKLSPIVIMLIVIGVSIIIAKKNQN